MRELRQFLTQAIAAKRKMKEVYYTARDADLKADVKELVASIIGIQKTIEELIKLEQKSKIAQKVLKDRKVSLTLRKWSVGLPKRVNSFTKRKKKMNREHLNRFYEALSEYIQNISEEINSWVIDIETLREIPRPPNNKS
jgi:Skp family chaperone for outer membrane proteins